MADSNRKNPLYSFTPSSSASSAAKPSIFEAKGKGSLYSGIAFGSGGTGEGEAGVESNGTEGKTQAAEEDQSRRDDSMGAKSDSVELKGDEKKEDDKDAGKGGSKPAGEPIKFFASCVRTLVPALCMFETIEKAAHEICAMTDGSRYLPSPVPTCHYLV
jgi:hypothetical protein